LVLGTPAGLRPPHVSLSHDGDRIACAASWRAPLGVDVQYPRPRANHKGIAEFLGWMPAPDASRFTRCWALWEAAAKASGMSVLGPVPIFDDCLRRAPGAPLARSVRCGAAWLALVCLAGRDLRVRRWRRPSVANA
jgi:hypothetical protein